MATSNSDDESEWRLLLRGRIMFILVLIIAVLISAWFVNWLSNGIGMNRIGDHYKQADEY